MRARYYSPELRRFINADVIAGEISNAITLNRYAYANGNPVSNIDPFGLSAERGGLTLSWNFDPGPGDYMGWGSDFYNVGSATYNYLKYGFYITKGEKGALVHGAFTKATHRQKIFGDEYSFKNAAKNQNVFKYIDPKTAAKSALKPSVSSLFGYLTIGVDVGYGIYENVKNGTRPQKTISDAIVDIGVGVGTMAGTAAAGAAIGSLIPIPLVGTIGGAAVGVVIYVLTDVMEINGKSIVGWVKEGAAVIADGLVEVGTWIADTAVEAWDATTDFVEDAGEWIADTASDAWDAATGFVEDAADWVSDTVSDAWDSVTGWFSGAFG